MARLIAGTSLLSASFCAILLLLLIASIAEARGGRRGGKGKGKTNLQFAQVAEFSLIANQMVDNRVGFLRFRFGF